MKNTFQEKANTYFRLESMLLNLCIITFASLPTLQGAYDYLDRIDEGK